MTSLGESNPGDCDIELAILFLGGTSTGKSSLIRTFMGENFMFANAATVGVDMKSKTIKLDEQQNKVIQLSLLDAAGQATFQTVVYSYFRKADCYAIVFDITSRKSFDDAIGWVQALEENNEMKPFFLIGNKIDLDKHAVKAADMEKFCDSHPSKPVPFMTSAKTGQNVEEMFYDIAEMMANNGCLRKPGQSLRKSTVDLELEAPKKRSTSTFSKGGGGGGNGDESDKCCTIL